MPSRNYYQSVTNNTIQHLISRNFAIDDRWSINDWAYKHIYGLACELHFPCLTFQLEGNFSTPNLTEGADKNAAENLEKLYLYLKSFQDRQFIAAKIQKSTLANSRIKLEFSTIRSCVAQATISYLIVDDLDRSYFSEATVSFSTLSLNETHKIEWTFRRRD
jgi:hypothetical protein